MFFKNLVEGKDPKLCPDNDGHNVDAIDALTTAIPVILRYSDSEPTIRNQKVMEAIRVIRGVKNVEPYAIHLSDLLVNVINGGDLRTGTQQVATKLGFGDL